MKQIFLILFLCTFCIIFQTGAIPGKLTRYCSYSPCCKTKGITYTDAEKKSCGPDECKEYSACKYSGKFAYCGTMTHSKVKDTNIVAFFSSKGDSKNYAKKKLRITQGGKSIDAIVCDTCGDNDCGGCCTRNAGSSGYLIDLEANTYVRSGFKDGNVDWRCLDCK